MTAQITQITLPVPTRKEPANFSPRMDTILSELPAFITQANALANEVNNNGVSAAASANTASTASVSANAAAQAASSTTNTTKWVSGTTYAEGATVWSPLSFLTYRCKIAGAWTTDPSTDATNWKAVSQGVPVGGIIAWSGGYFADGINSGFVNVLGNTVADVNARFNIDGWYACNGALLNLPASPLFNGAGRYLPNLSDSRFIMGDTSAGLIGGANTADHTHTTADHTHTTADHTHTTVDHTHTTVDHTHYADHQHYTADATLSIAQLAPHNHGIQTSFTGGPFASRFLIDSVNTAAFNGFVVSTVGSGAVHNHAWTGTATGQGVNTGGASAGNTTSVASAGNTTSVASAGNTTSGASTGNTTSGASVSENRPSFLSCYYLIKVF